MDKIRIGSPVFCCDGEEAGEVGRVVIDPESGAVTHLVVFEQGQLSREVVVPIDMVRRSNRGELFLSLGVRELEFLPEYVEAEYVSPYTSAPFGGGYRHEEVLFPVEHAITDKEDDIAPGKPVQCHGELCGMVDEVLRDPVSGKILSFKLRHSGKLTHDVVVPIEWVLDSRGERVQLECNVTQLEEELPPAQGIERAASA